MELITLAVMQWLILHVPGGQEVSVNVKRINSLRAGEGGDKNILLTGAVRCVIAMDDGKLVNVTETCADVRRHIELLEQQEEK